MSDVKVISKRVKADSIKQVIGNQILFYCYDKDIWLNKSEFDTLLHIAVNGYDKKTTLSEIVNLKVFKSTQCVRNARGKLVKLNLLIEPSKRNFILNPELGIQNKGRVLFETKMININEA